MYYQCKHFTLPEICDRQTCSQLGEQAWMLFRQDLLITLDAVREYFGKPIVINNWQGGGNLSLCGFRPYDSQVGAKFSQHRLGNAADLHMVGMDADEIRAEIIKNQDHEAFKLISCLETGIQWVHLDCRNIGNRILLVKP